MEHWILKRTTFSVTDFMSWMRAGELTLSPSFQRRPVWKPKAKAFFLDTIIRGLPVPIIFVREKTDVDNLKTVREIVDGQQRLRTIFSFVEPKLLKDFKKNRDPFELLKTYTPEFAGVSFNELPKEVREQILGYEFSVDVLPRNADDADVLAIFKRLNATGVRLNAQELRNAEYFGEFSASVDKLALRNLGRWRRWGLFSEDAIARMEETEFVSELYILLLAGIFGRTKRTIDGFYEEYDEAFPDRAQCEKRVALLLDLIDEEYGDELKESIFQRRPLFFVLFAALYERLYGLGSALDASKHRPISKRAWAGVRGANRDFKRGKVSEEVQEAAARRTTHKSSRQILVNFIVERL